MDDNSGQHLSSNKPIVWIDMEMTGLDPDTNGVLEIATIITDANLQILEEGPNLVIQTPAAILEAMDDWNVKQHRKSGLWDAALASSTTLAQAEELTLAFLKKHVGPNSAALAGNSVWQDRRFLRRYMAKIDQYLHYRIIDVSSIKELCRRWYRQLPDFKGKDASSHRALDDIRESIDELKYYRSNVFRSPAEVNSEPIRS